MNAFFGDLRHAFRSLLRTPGFTLTAVLTLGLGIGANTAIFSLVDRILLRPLPFPESHRLMAVTETNLLGAEIRDEAEHGADHEDGVIGRGVEAALDQDGFVEQGDTGIDQSEDRAG